MCDVTRAAVWVPPNTGKMGFSITSKKYCHPYASSRWQIKLSKKKNIHFKFLCPPCCLATAKVQYFGSGWFADLILLYILPQHWQEIHQMFIFGRYLCRLRTLNGKEREIWQTFDSAAASSVVTSFGLHLVTHKTSKLPIFVPKIPFFTAAQRLVLLCCRFSFFIFSDFCFLAMVF